MSIVTVNRSFQERIGAIITGRQDVLTEPSRRLHGAPQSTVARSGVNAFNDFFQLVRTPAERLKEMKYYDYLETEIPDVRKALDAFATMAVTGNLAGGGTSTFQVRTVNDEEAYPKKLLEELKRIERLIQNNAYTSVRNMLKYGTYTPQLIIEKPGKRKLVGKLKPLPPGTIFRNVKKGGESDPKKYWVQVIDGKVVGTDSSWPSEQSNVGIPQWVLPHFALWSNVVNAEHTLLYGTSILQPFGAIGLKVHAALDAAVVARLTRAAMRYLWKIDCSDIKNDQAAIQRRVKRWQDLVSREVSLMNNSTEMDSFKKAPVPDADFFVPAAEGLAWDLDTIAGDMNLPNVKDLELLVRFYFGALGVPPEYLGHERSQGGRSSLTQIDIHFARTVRHVQLFAVPAFEHIVFATMVLGGWDPLKYPIQVVPPQIGARDDLLQAQIQALQSSVIANLVAAGMDPSVNPAWILETFMHFDEELSNLEKDQIESLFKAQPTAAPPEGPAQGSDEARRIYSVMERTTGDLMAIVRDNLRLLITNNAPLAGHYGHEQPTPAELLTAINQAA